MRRQYSLYGIAIQNGVRYLHIPAAFAAMGQVLFENPGSQFIPRE
jgi:hypothetical protein